MPKCPECKQPLTVDGPYADGDPLDRWEANCMTETCETQICVHAPTVSLLIELAAKEVSELEPRP